MCFVIAIVLGAFAVALWLKGIQLYAILTGIVAIAALLLTLRKIVKNGPCLFGTKRDC